MARGILGLILGIMAIAFIVLSVIWFIFLGILVGVLIYPNDHFMQGIVFFGGEGVCILIAFILYKIGSYCIKK